VATVARQPALAPPALSVRVLEAASVEPAAAPMLAFTLELACAPAVEVRSVLLDVQVQIAARQRDYGPVEEARLLELFGTRERWGTTLRTLPWLRTTLVVPGFTARATVTLTLPCTYDLEVTAARYMAALGEGEIPLELLFSGSLFYAGEDGGLQVARIGWDCEAGHRLPVAVWRRMMNQHFPDSAWLRLGRETLERLMAFRAAGTFTSWDAALDALLEERG
jgi:hypothetical protein